MASSARIVEADLGDESTTAEDLMSKLQSGGAAASSYDYVWDNASKGDTGAGKAVVDCAKAWKSRMLVYVSSAGIYKPDGVASFCFGRFHFLFRRRISDPPRGGYKVCGGGMIRIDDL